jgi:hypothetical protein
MPPTYWITSLGSVFSDWAINVLHTTEATVQAMTQRQQDYLLAVKQTRAHTHAAIQQVVAQQARTPTATQVDDSHGRSVVRRAQTFILAASLQARWHHLNDRRSGTADWRTQPSTLC